jgi:hypothetical protein
MVCCIALHIVTNLRWTFSTHLHLAHLCQHIGPYPEILKCPWGHWCSAPPLPCSPIVPIEGPSPVLSTSNSNNSTSSTNTDVTQTAQAAAPSGQAGEGDASFGSPVPSAPDAGASAPANVAPEHPAHEPGSAGDNNATAAVSVATALAEAGPPLSEGPVMPEDIHVAGITDGAGNAEGNTQSDRAAASHPSAAAAGASPGATGAVPAVGGHPSHGPEGAQASRAAGSAGRAMTHCGHCHYTVITFCTVVT